MANMVTRLILAMTLLFHFSACGLLEFKVSRKQYREARTAFNRFDTDGDGTVSITNLGSIFRSLGFELEGEELKELEDWADEEGTGLVTWETFKALFVLKLRETELEQELQEAFSVLDTDEDGVVSLDALSRLLVGLGDDLTPQEIEMIVTMTDRDSSGTIDLIEFSKLLTSDLH